MPYFLWGQPVNSMQSCVIQEYCSVFGKSVKKILEMLNTIFSYRRVLLQHLRSCKEDPALELSYSKREIISELKGGKNISSSLQVDLCSPKWYADTINPSTYTYDQIRNRVFADVLKLRWGHTRGRWAFNPMWLVSL